MQDESERWERGRIRWRGTMLEILVDFNNMTDDGRMVLLASPIDPRDVGLVSVLVPDMRVIVVDPDDVEFEAVVVTENRPSGIWWWGDIDHATRIDL
jgi:hypothetical protein